MKAMMALAAVLTASQAQAEAPQAWAAPKAQIAALTAQAAASIKPDQPMVSLPVLRFGPYATSLEYRRAAANAAVHGNAIEFFQVVEGSGTLVLGGTLVDGKVTSPGNLSAPSSFGGTARHVAKGDVFAVAAGQAHWFNQIDGALVMLTTKLPAGTP